MTDKEKVLSYLKISVVRNDPTGAAIFLISVLCFCCKIVTLRKDYVLVGTSLRWITMTGSVVRDPHGHGEFSKTRLTNFRGHKRAIL